MGDREGLNQHTPGPWTADDHYVFAGDLLIAYFDAEGVPPERGVYNTLLAAAAPDLLASIKALSAVSDGVWVQGVSDGEMKLLSDAWAAVDAAIAKAEGRHVS